MGVPLKAIKQIHSPIGIEIYAETPEEIAVSIMAEIIKLHEHKAE
jgi:xanthine dehydrogenase accessory factor